MVVKGWIQILQPLLPFLGVAFAAQGWEYFDFNFNLKPIIWTNDAAKNEEVKQEAKPGVLKENVVIRGDTPLKPDQVEILNELEK